MKRATHRDIAKIAGVSHVTVSLALRAHRSIPQATRERIEKIAKEIGYRPDPALSALMVYRRGAKPSGYQGTLAWINNYHGKPDALRRAFGNYWIGANRRCDELGYRLEEFRMVDLRMNFKLLSKVLRARNIQGLLFPPQDSQRHIPRSQFDWENYSLIAFGFSLMRPQLDIVTNAQFRSARLAMRKLRSLGYRRIGYVSSPAFEERTDHNFMAGYLIEQRRFLPSHRLIPHVISFKGEAEQNLQLRKWFLREKPDAVIVASGIASPGFVSALSYTKRKVCGYAFLDVPAEDMVVSGVNQNNQMIGRVAVDTLIAKIHAQERGIPEVPRRILVEGRWKDGTTAPRLTGK